MDNNERVNAVIFALNRLPHDQTALGLGFNLSHNPEQCVRCVAQMSVIQLGALLQMKDKELEPAVSD